MLQRKFILLLLSMIFCQLAISCRMYDKKRKSNHEEPIGEEKKETGNDNSLVSDQEAFNYLKPVFDKLSVFSEPSAAKNILEYQKILGEIKFTKKYKQMIAKNTTTQELVTTLTEQSTFSKVKKFCTDDEIFALGSLLESEADLEGENLTTMNQLSQGCYDKISDEKEFDYLYIAVDYENDYEYPKSTLIDRPVYACKDYFECLGDHGLVVLQNIKVKDIGNSDKFLLNNVNISRDDSMSLSDNQTKVSLKLPWPFKKVSTFLKNTKIKYMQSDENSLFLSDKNEYFNEYIYAPRYRWQKYTPETKSSSNKISLFQVEKAKNAVLNFLEEQFEDITFDYLNDHIFTYNQLVKMNETIRLAHDQGLNENLAKDILFFQTNSLVNDRTKVCKRTGISAVNIYTSNEYADINEALRKNRGDEFQSLIDALNECLLVLKPYVGYVYRGTTLPEAVLKEHEKDVVIAYKGYTSTSVKSEGAFGGDHFFTIDSRTGRHIKDFSVFQGEDEVLFFPRSFKIVNKRTGKKDGTDEYEIYFELQEN